MSLGVDFGTSGVKAIRHLASWLRILAASFGHNVRLVESREVGPALGAARLASIASGDLGLADACLRPVAVSGVAAGLLRRRGSIGQEIDRAKNASLKPSGAVDPASKEMGISS